MLAKQWNNERSTWIPLDHLPPLPRIQPSNFCSIPATLSNATHLTVCAQCKIIYRKSSIKPPGGGGGAYLFQARLRGGGEAHLI